MLAVSGELVESEHSLPGPTLIRVAFPSPNHGRDRIGL